MTRVPLNKSHRCLSERRNYLWFLVARASSAWYVPGWGGEKNPQEQLTMPGGTTQTSYHLALCVLSFFFPPAVLGIKLRISCMPESVLLPSYNPTPNIMFLTLNLSG